MTRPLAAALAVLLAPTLASAKQPGIEPEYSVLTLMRPYQGESDVPLNTRIWIDAETATESMTYAVPREPRLFAPDSVVVYLGDPLELVAPGGILRVYTPPSLLPNTTYELRNCDDDDCSHLLASFTTIDAPDSDPPAPPKIDDAYTLGQSFYLEAEFADDILVIGRPDASAEPLESHTLVAATTRYTQLDLATYDTPSELRFATYDLAGNFSGWTKPHEVEAIAITHGPAYGCRTTTSSPPWLLLLLLRRRRTTP